MGPVFLNMGGAGTDALHLQARLAGHIVDDRTKAGIARPYPRRQKAISAIGLRLPGQGKPPGPILERDAITGGKAPLIHDHQRGAQKQALADLCKLAHISHSMRAF